MFGFDDIPLLFLIDHTFFHDFFRTDYPHSDVADWLFRYTHYRNALVPNEKIITVPEVIFNKVQFEFPIYHNIVPSVIQALCEVIKLFPIKITDPNSAIVNVVDRLLSKDTIPIIISSVSEDKLLDQFQNWGLKIGLEGFTEVMSKRRIYNKFPCFLIDTKKEDTKETLYAILSLYDSEYNKVIQYMSP